MKIGQLILSLLLVGAIACAMEQDNSDDILDDIFNEDDLSEEIKQIRKKSREADKRKEHPLQHYIIDALFKELDSKNDNDTRWSVIKLLDATKKRVLSIDTSKERDDARMKKLGDRLEYMANAYELSEQFCDKIWNAKQNNTKVLLNTNEEAELQKLSKQVQKILLPFIKLDEEWDCIVQ